MNEDQWDVVENSPTGVLGLMRWIGLAQRQNAEDWVRERGLSVEQSFVLGYLERFPGAIQRDIAAVTRTSAASVSSLLQGLERRGLVERKSVVGDVRRKGVYLTADAAELMVGFADAISQGDTRIMAPLTEAEIATLHSLLSKVTATLPKPSR
ncbi:MarR family winged helix-turn-helix transcriptional regulator [Glutamicibacter sp.]|uniref:MarR family winged helix-turn-helix transcriptional regulator n=1 Tax=Glutamicibacter sp. TaxID=1931995 RepID=UPI0028BD97B3|nr:MarR family winged helix-turn-helix transcriptional regulator [Glutamicibacter sp.]